MLSRLHHRIFYSESWTYLGVVGMMWVLVATLYLLTSNLALALVVNTVVQSGLFFERSRALRQTRRNYYARNAH
jgi:hypothetical protein